MRRDFKFEKRAIMAGLMLLIAADVALAMYSYQLSSSPSSPRQQLIEQVAQLKLLRNEVNRAKEVKDRIPATQKECDQFEQSLRPVGTAYSALSGELGEIAKKSGSQVDGLIFKQKEIPSRGLDEVTIDATVSGSYVSVVNFLNGLQRSKSLYSVTGLAASTDTSNQSGNSIRVTLHLKTYFRAA